MFRRLSTIAGFGAALLVAGCSSPKPPAEWQKGGTALEIPRARWVRGDAVIELSRNGAVYVDGDHELTVDRAGRVYQPDGEPVALLQADGRLVGPDDEDLGVVGTARASLPGSDEVAWLGLYPSGELVVYGDEGQRLALGVWLGCHESPREAQTCVLISHLMARELRRRAQAPAVTFGVGVGVGF
ncbi:MAG: hypothetical protein JRI23_14050 [Deltaproteobacteria bacterium]|jgi:hypothetical protein|nr:hypothetical protein [Deltaproteobacteria bacterium]MBW2532853.1 hypothetical protein [Deltaproteobacteria bacterium]